MPEISVIVPVYKVEPYLRRCVDSILAQTFTDFELILVDDGSPDNCGMICDEYAQKDRRVRVIHQENKGQAQARNRAVSQALGKMINFIDADDVAHPLMLERLYSALNGSTESISVCGAIESDIIGSFLTDKIGRITLKRYSPGERELINLYDDPYICWVVWGKLIPVEIAKQYPFENGRVFEDNAVTIKWLLESENIIVLSQPLYYYQINPEGTTKSLETEKRVVDWLWSRDQLLEYFSKNCLYGLYKKCVSKMFVVGAYKYFDTQRSDKELALFIKRQMKSRWNQYKNRVELDRNSRSYIYEMLFPTEARIVSKIRSILKKG